MNEEQKKLLNESLELLLKLSNKLFFFYVDDVKEIALKIHTAYNFPADSEKHLYPKDLEELGFDGNMYKERYCIYTIMVDKNEVPIDYIRYIGIRDELLNRELFQGEIKNKSELRQLMQQLSIA